MTTLEGFIYYCNEPEPVGTWLEKAIGTDSCRTKNFAVWPSYNRSNRWSVNSAWMNAYLEDKGWDEKSETLGKFKDILSRLPWTENIKNVVSLLEMKEYKWRD